MRQPSQAIPLLMVALVPPTPQEKDDVHKCGDEKPSMSAVTATL
jgi:hypothetical protein